MNPKNEPNLGSLYIAHNVTGKYLPISVLGINVRTPKYHVYTACIFLPLFIIFNTLFVLRIYIIF